MKQITTRRKFLYQSALFTAGLSMLDFSTFARSGDGASSHLPHYVIPDTFEHNLRKHTLLGAKPIQLRGNVYNAQQQVIKNAEITFWHNDAEGRFHKNKFRGKVASNSKGNYAFSTYKPGKYVVEDGHKLPSRAFLLVQAAGYEPQLSVLHFTHDGHCHIDGATYEQSAVIPRPSLPTATQLLGESIITYHVYLKSTNISSTASTKTDVPLRLYPNPVVKEAFVDIDGERLGNTTIRIFNATGKLMNELTVDGTGMHKVALPVASLRAGMYFVKVSSERSTTQTKKMLIRR